MIAIKDLNEFKASAPIDKSRERQSANPAVSGTGADDCSVEFNIEMLLENNDSLEVDSQTSSAFFTSQPGMARTNSELSTVYNRKEKSLGELCRRFLYYYGIEGKGILYLDQCTKELGVERRRIYDIINILESFSVIRRRAKNEYHWRGIDWIILSIDH